MSYTNATTAQISQAIAEGNLSASDALIIIDTRIEKAKPGSYKQRRLAIIAEQLASEGNFDAAAAFRGAKADPKPASKKPAKSKAKAKPNAINALAAQFEGMDAKAQAAFIKLVLSSK
ncbi:MAG: hypothetical protein EBR05_08755 [Marivivens sp.]|nr:hypothetical protein [Marivivens sp.]NBT50559.1 hypothetical protein [Marivivens sp.]NBX09884.1 hypothetical protein [Marivivens sp.]NCW69686.1 hypothetical protein [Marivivens sp.]NDH02270.1 hypothetical protein [Marivivens sp.]